MTTRSRSKKVEQENPSIAAKLSVKCKKEKQQAKRIKLEVKVEPVESWQPGLWKEQLENIRKMRTVKDAPVDTMGCERTSGENFSEKEKRYHILVSLMLSSMTKDQTTYAAVQKLLDHGLTPENIQSTSEKVLEKLIYPVGFYKKKAIHLKAAAAILQNKFDGDIPRSVEELCSLPGVGPKMAYLAMSCAWNEVVGIGVDVHVHRIANRIGWVKKVTKKPEDTRKELEDWLPRDYWKEINWLLVGFGQQVCLPMRPKCSECLNKNICPFPKTSQSSKVVIKKEKKEKASQKK